MGAVKKKMDQYYTDRATEALSEADRTIWEAENSIHTHKVYEFVTAYQIVVEHTGDGKARMFMCDAFKLNPMEKDEAIRRINLFTDTLYEVG